MAVIFMCFVGPISIERVVWNEIYARNVKFDTKAEKDVGSNIIHINCFPPISLCQHFSAKMTVFSCNKVPI